MALKVLLPSTARDARALRDFAEEVTLLSTLSHPHIVACFGAGLCPSASGDVPFLAMEAVTGGDLRAVVTRATMDPTVYCAADIARWASQIAAALHHLHTRTPMVIYRDLKLENVMLTGAQHACSRLARGRHQWCMLWRNLDCAERVRLPSPCRKMGRAVNRPGASQGHPAGPEPALRALRHDGRHRQPEVHGACFLRNPPW